MKVGKIVAAIVALTLGGVVITTATTAATVSAPAATTPAPAAQVNPYAGMPYD